MDDDNDGFRDNAELYCNSDSLDSNSIPLDTDGDDTCDSLDDDDDGDGYSDQIDSFPVDSSEWYDFDNDGIGDNSDSFPSISRYQSMNDFLVDLILIIAIFGGMISLFIYTTKKKSV